MLSFASDSSSSNVFNIESAAPNFHTEDDEICWRLLLMYCDYHASKISAPTLRNPRISRIKRFFDSMASDQGGDAYFPYSIKNHLCLLTRALHEVKQKRWAFQLATLIQDWFIDPSTNLLRVEIRDKFSAHFTVWSKMISAARMEIDVVDNSLGQAYGFMIFQGFYKIVKDDETTLILNGLCRLLTKADYCSPDALAETFGLSMAGSKPKSVPALTMSFDRLSLKPQQDKVKNKKKSNNTNQSGSSSLPFFSLKY